MADGGRLARLLGCESWVTAIAMTSYVPAQATEEDRWCDELPIPAMSILPENSLQVPIDGSIGCDGLMKKTLPASRERFEQLWTDRLFCTDPEPWGDPKRAECRRWSCHGESEFVSCVAPGGIGWAGTHQPRAIFCANEPPAPTYPAETELWEFFMSAPPQREPVAQ